MSTPLKDFRLGITETIDLALTATATAFDSDKAAVARDVLAEWARKKLHEHTVYARGLVANGNQPDLWRQDAEEDGTSRKGRG